MVHPLALGLLGAALALQGPAGSGRRPGPADFKLVVEVFGVRPEPTGRFDLIVRAGRAYRYDPAGSELLVFDPEAGRVEVLDLRRKVQTRASLRELAAALDARRAALEAHARRLERAGGRANEVEAQMTRDLLGVGVARRFDADRGRLRLVNESVEVEVVGTPEADPARRSLVVAALVAFARLAVLREPDGEPPFVRLAAIEGLDAERPLRPAELTCIYRLAGPPRKTRWTYRLEPMLTDREVEAVRRLDAFRAGAPRLVPEDFDAPPRRAG